MNKGEVHNAHQTERLSRGSRQASRGFGRQPALRSKRNVKTGSRNESKLGGAAGPTLDIFDSQVASQELSGYTLLRGVPRDNRGNPWLDPGVRRTLERRIKAWRAEHGADKDVIFRQKKEPGRVGISDFTTMNSLESRLPARDLITSSITSVFPGRGSFTPRQFYGGESFGAFSRGLRRSFWGCWAAFLGSAAPDSLRRLSAISARHEVDGHDRKLQGVLRLRDGADAQQPRGRPRKPIESSHGHLKREIGDALALRDSRDFADLDSYRDFIAESAKRSKRPARGAHRDRAHGAWASSAGTSGLLSA